MPRVALGTLGLALAVGTIAGCGGSSSTTTASPAATGSPSGSAAAGTPLTVTLDHVPHGQTTIAYDAATRAMRVSIHLVGLAPSSVHPAHIHAGTCAKQGAVIYPLTSVVANSKGVADSSTTVAAVKEGAIPKTGWYVNVHNGPGLSPADQFLPVVCGDVADSSGAADVTVPLVGGPPPPSQPGSPDQAATGRATLTVANGGLDVAVDLKSLMPGSTHAAHIHLGSCENQGAVIYPLKPLTADADGNATGTTTIPNVTSVPAGKWYINVHRTASLSTQTGFDPILCGDITGQIGG